MSQGERTTGAGQAMESDTQVGNQVFVIRTVQSDACAVGPS
jgi:hypothetical protein